MSTAGEKIPLEQFLDEAVSQIRVRVEDGATRARTTLAHLMAHASEEPEIRAQLEDLTRIVTTDLADRSRTERLAAANEADALRRDLKERWISADNPPLVEEVDEHLAEIATGIEALRTGDPPDLRAIARRIDTLSQRADAHGAIETRFLPWARFAGVLFVIGLVLLIFPQSFADVPVLSNRWAAILFLMAFPGIAVLYAWQALPRSRIDAEIEALNRTHFQPLRGIYFAEGAEPAGVIRIDPIPDADPEGPRDPRKPENRIGPLW